MIHGLTKGKFMYEKIRGHNSWWLRKNGKSIANFDINGAFSDEESESNIDDVIAGLCSAKDLAELHQALYEMYAQYKCGCGHPACNRCSEDSDNGELLHRIGEKYTMAGKLRGKHYD